MWGQSTSAKGCGAVGYAGGHHVRRALLPPAHQADVDSKPFVSGTVKSRVAKPCMASPTQVARQPSGSVTQAAKEWE